MNDNIDWAVPDPVGKLIEQEHDLAMLAKSLAECCKRKAGPEQVHGQKRVKGA